jgi:hypothetical protein
MSSHDDENVSDEDSAPEAISFDAAKNENIEQLQKVKEQVNIYYLISVLFLLMNILN